MSGYTVSVFCQYHLGIDSLNLYYIGLYVCVCVAQTDRPAVKIRRVPPSSSVSVIVASVTVHGSRGFTRVKKYIKREYLCTLNVSTFVH